MHICGANTDRPCQALKLEARESGIIEEIRLENSYRNPQRSPSMFDLILFEKCLAEANLTLLLNTSVVGADARDGLIRTATALRPSTEDQFTIRSKVFVDCSGDSALGVAAGAAYMQGRENRSSFGESLAQEVEDKKTLGSTLLLMARKHERPMPFIPPPWARKFTEGDLRLRPHATSEVDSGLEYGFWWIEWGGQHDTIKDNEAIRDELLAIVMGVWDHIKNDGQHEAEYWALDWFGAVPGKRESRRLLGQYVLTEQDLLECRPQPDAIGYGGWPIDMHPPEGVDKPDEPPCTTTKVPFLYDIPLRSCIARDIKNLMFAGRNLSATHVAFASTRIMATCASVGEAVGIAAAYATKNNLFPADLTSDSRAVRDIRQRLLGEDAYLIGEPYAGENDLAFSADIRASSEQADGAAKNVISAQNRSVLGERGVPADREIPGSHRWMSDPGQGLSAWIELRWNHPIEFRVLEIVFDSGLHRHLTLTHSDAYFKSMHWGTGQPECAKDYRVEIERDRAWSGLANVKNNWQRRNRHTYPDGLTCQALRITVDAMWGIDHARIVQVKVRNE